MFSANRHHAGDRARRGKSTRSCRSLFPATSRRPFRHHPQTTRESQRPEPTPKLSTIPTSGLPCRIELGQIRLQGTLSHAEHITTRTPDHPANRGTAMTRPTDDLFDRDAIFDQIRDLLVDFLTPFSALVLP